MKKVLTITLVPLLLSLLVACSNQPIVDDSHPFFPTWLLSKINAFPALPGEHGVLVLDNGYLRIGRSGPSGIEKSGPVLIWPYGFSLKMENGEIKIIDRERNEVAWVGKIIECGGIIADKDMAEGVTGRKVPEGAPGTFYVVGQITSSVPPAQFTNVVVGPPPTIDATTELKIIQNDVFAMMADHGLSALPEGDIAGTGNSTKDMTIFPSSRYHLYGMILGNVYVNYVVSRYSTGTYSVDTRGTVTQVATGY